MNYSLKVEALKKRQFLTNLATKKDIEAVSECTINLLKGNIPLSKTQYDKFYKCKDAIRTLANRKNSLKTKKEIINQRGGF